MQEEKKVKYLEGMDSTVTHEDDTFFVDILLHLAEKKAMQDFPIQRLAWIFSHSEEDLNLDRVDKANTVYPLIITEVPNFCRGRPSSYFVVLDGYHRLAKAMLAGRTKVKVRKLTLDEIRKAHLEPISDSDFWKNHPYI